MPIALAGLASPRARTSPSATATPSAARSRLAGARTAEQLGREPRHERGAPARVVAGYGRGPSPGGTRRATGECPAGLRGSTRRRAMSIALSYPT